MAAGIATQGCSFYPRCVRQPPITITDRGFHLLTKPVGPICNLDCHYCFYLAKEKLYPGETVWRMSEAVLEEYIRQYIASQPTAEIHFAWQGGEPTLLGLDFFRQAVALQQRHAQGKTIGNALQTNGTLLDAAWGEFLAEHQFLVGLSLDGPAELHDRYRVDKNQRPTFASALRGLEVLKRHGVAFNTLTVVNRTNAQAPLEVYRFLQSIGSQYLQFIPLVERAGFPAGSDAATSPVMPWSVEAEQYGNFLCAIFDEWVRHDVGKTFVQLFDVALGNWLGLGSSLCVFAEECGTALAVEHNGDVFSCDHFVYAQYRLGNLMNQSLGAMVQSPAQLQFGRAKSAALPEYCRACDVRFACQGECPKHRFITTPAGEGGLNYLCAGYQKFFRHIDPHMRTMAQLLQNDEAPARIMEMLRPTNPDLKTDLPCP